MSPVSVSLAATGVPTFSPAGVFSATLKASISFGNVGALLVVTSELTTKTGERA